MIHLDYLLTLFSIAHFLFVLVLTVFCGKKKKNDKRQKNNLESKAIAKTLLFNDFKQEDDIVAEDTNLRTTYSHDSKSNVIEQSDVQNQMLSTDKKSDEKNYYNSEESTSKTDNPDMAITGVQNLYLEDVIKHGAYSKHETKEIAAQTAQNRPNFQPKMITALKTPQLFASNFKQNYNYQNDIPKDQSKNRNKECEAPDLKTIRPLGQPKPAIQSTYYK